jgi:hypothetical protein
LRTLKIGFALLSSAHDPAPSTRIACLNLFPHLAALDLQPVVLFEQRESILEPDMTGVAEQAAARGCDVVVFQKIHGPSVLQCVTRLREIGIRSVYCGCDFVDDAMAAAVDRTAVVTHFLRSLYAPQLQSKIDVVHDGIEKGEVVKPSSVGRQRERLEAVLVTSQQLYALPVVGVPPAPWRVNVIGPYERDATLRMRSLRWTLMRVSNLHKALAMIGTALHPRIRYTAWSLAGVYEGLIDADVGILPVNTSDTTVNAYGPVPAWQLKSENRLTLKMAIGLPVVATPIPSYESVIEHGVNGFLARSRQDWTRHLRELRDPQLRIEMGAKARVSVAERYSLAAQMQKLAECIRRACDARSVRMPVAGAGEPDSSSRSGFAGTSTPSSDADHA